MPIFFWTSKVLLLIARPRRFRRRHAQWLPPNLPLHRLLLTHLALDQPVVRQIRQRQGVVHRGDDADLADVSSLLRTVNDVQPDEIYNLAAQSHVKVSFDLPEYTAETDAIGTLRLLEAVRICGLVEKTRIYQASTSELYGAVRESPQSETTPFYPRSPYGVAKLYAYWITVNYREAYNMYACNGILFNHESPRRGNSFVSKKILLLAFHTNQNQKL